MRAVAEKALTGRATFTVLQKQKKMK